MIIFNRNFIGVICGITLFGLVAIARGDSSEHITEEGCVRLQDAEIIWDLSKYRWLCCIPKNSDEYESCMPISDMQPLPKTSLKPFPPKGPQTIKNNPR